jgi:hypothetical protein
MRVQKQCHCGPIKTVESGVVQCSANAAATLEAFYD